MKSFFSKSLFTLALILFSIMGFSQKSNIIIEFEVGDAGLFTKDSENNLSATFIVSNIEADKIDEFSTNFKKDKGVLEFTTSKKDGKIVAFAKFIKSDLNFFYELFKNNGIAAIMVNGKTTKVKYLELKSDPIIEPTSFKAYQDVNHIDYFNKRVSDAEFKINWVQHDRDEIKKALLSGWFEEAENTVNRLIKERKEFIIKNK